VSDPVAPNPYAPPQSDLVAGAVEPRPVYEGYVYRPLRGLANVILGALAVLCLVDLSSALHAFVGIGLMRRLIAAAPVGQEDLLIFDGVTRILLGLRTLAMLVVAVVFCLFMARANRNARSFGCSPLRFTPRWSAGVFFVPIWNLYKPYRAVAELWQASESRAGVPWQTAPTPGLLHVWWAAWLAYCVLSQIIAKSSEQKGPAAFITYLHAHQAGTLVAIAATVLFMLVIRRLTRRFEQRAADITPR
jgi:hypothetical protein